MKLSSLFIRSTRTMIAPKFSTEAETGNHKMSSILQIFQLRRAELAQELAWTTLDKLQRFVWGQRRIWTAKVQVAGVQAQ